MNLTGIDPLAIGLEVRLGQTHRENARTKALRYLVSGRVQVRSVTPEGISAYVRGSGHLRAVTYEAGSWSCDCPARGQCSHLIAVQTVVVAPPDPRIPPEGFRQGEA